MKNNYSLDPTVPTDIRRDFGTSDDPEALVPLMLYQRGASFTGSVFEQLPDALNKHPEFKAYLDIGRTALGAAREKTEQEPRHDIEFHATTFEEAENLPNRFGEATAEIVFDIWRREGAVDLSRGVYDDNQYEKLYSDNIEMLGREYYEEMKLLRKKYSAQGFDTQDNSLAFLQCDSPEYVDTVRQGKHLRPTKRIYLNPHPRDTAQVFSSVLDAMAENELAASAKVAVDPLVEGSLMRHRDDRIVIYVDDAQADAMLAMVIDVYKEYESSFEKSRTPIVTTELAPGLSVAGEKDLRSNDGERYSASSYREVILSKLMGSIQERHRKAIKDGSYDSEILTVFTKKVNEVFQRLGIDEQNWSFYT